MDSLRRRVRAARLAGLAEVPVVVREGVTDRDHLLLALIENVQRRDLTVLEAAEAYRHLREDFGLTQEDVAARVGKDRATVANFLRLLKLPEEVRADVASGALSMGHARALLALSSDADQRRVARDIVNRSLSVRETESIVRKAAAPNEPKTPSWLWSPVACPGSRECARLPHRVQSIPLVVERRRS